MGRKGMVIRMKSEVQQMYLHGSVDYVVMILYGNMKKLIDSMVDFIWQYEI